MRYWNVQRIVREYVCPVRMVADPGRDVGPGHIQSPEHGYPGTERGLRNNRRNMRSSGESSPGKESNDLFLERPPPCESAKISFFAFSAWPNKVWSLTRSNEYGYV